MGMGMGLRLEELQRDLEGLRWVRLWDCWDWWGGFFDHWGDFWDSF
jgi:hypothetical protein